MNQKELKSKCKAKCNPDSEVQRKGMPVRISVIICTLNRAERLTAAVDSLLAQSYDMSGLEIIIVDNNSEDSTPEVCSRIIKSSGQAGIKYFLEQKRGLSHARNRGIREASGEIVAFIDDDAVAHPDWLKNIERAFQDATVFAVGGKVLPVFELPRPDWLYRGIDSILTILDLGNEPRRFDYPHSSPCGANIAFRKAVFDRAGCFDPALGRAGERLLGADETDLYIRMKLKGLACVYCPECIVHHHVPKGRLTKSYVRKRFFYQAASAAYVSLKYDSFRRVILRDLRGLLGRDAEDTNTLNTRDGSGEKGFFYYEAKLILYASYLLFLALYRLRPGRK
jgi:glycosyltransferase involved in cell wall biosynthesis